MKVFVTKWATSGRVDLVDLALDDTGKYWCGDDVSGFHYFLSNKEAHTTLDDAKRDVVKRFVSRRESLRKQLEGLTKVELSVLESLENMKNNQ